MSTVEDTLRPADIARYAAQVGFRGRDLVTAVAIALAESSGRPGVNNSQSGPGGTRLNADGTVDYGLWQINSIHGPDLNRIYEPAYNARHAYRIFKERGDFSAWSSFNDDSYLRHLAEAEKAAAQLAGSAAKGFGGVVPGSIDPRTMMVKGLKAMARLKRPPREPEEVALEVERPDDELELEGADGGGGAEFAEEINAFLEQRAVIAEPEEIPVEAPVGDTGVPEVGAEAINAFLGRGLKENAARGAAIARALGFSGTIHGVGSRPPSSKSDHPHGNAIDLMVFNDTELGDTLAEFFRTHRDMLGVKYVIWNNRIASARGDWVWRPYRHPSGNSNPTLNHEDHPHVSFL